MLYYIRGSAILKIIFGFKFLTFADISKWVEPEKVRLMDNRGQKVAKEYNVLQLRACEIVEKAEGTTKFVHHDWTKEIGSGNSAVLQGGQRIEKAAINFSQVSGNYTEEMAKSAGMKPGKFFATGISSIMHPINPMVPIIHMNVRYFELEDGTSWFGGGIDLTPHYIDKKEAAWFHQQLKAVCDRFDVNFYPDFMKQADDYFFLSHRNETRGVGGIFFDHQQPSGEEVFEKLFEFTTALAKLYPEIYVEILENKSDKAFGEKEKEWQNIRRGRYVEFNLIHDRGTKFGLVSGGNTESILLSMPPLAEWKYQFVPEPGSAEEYTLRMLKKDIDWIHLK
ncbi:MAG: oxygen-dependent coproporphyrinogen oxidase [Bacteroidales bacterium]|nr:oxygen-dependent coproporphyrinogen oxidase [Bacteroidales bacterium]